MGKRKVKQAIVKSKCHYRECDKTFKHPRGTIQYYCSKLHRYLSRGGKKGIRKASKLLDA